MNKLFLILLLSFAASPVCAMGDGGEDAPPAYPQLYPLAQEQFVGMACAQPAVAPAQATDANLLSASQLNSLLAIDDNNNQLLAALMAQNNPLVNLCLSNQRMLSGLIALHNSAPAAMANSQQNRNLLRAQQALAKAEQEDAPKRIDGVLLKAEQQLKEQLVTTKQSGHDMMGYITVKLEGKELQDEIEKYVANMSAVESSLMKIMSDKYISEPQSNNALKLLEQARRQSQKAKRGESEKKPLSWADLNAQWRNQ